MLTRTVRPRGRVPTVMAVGGTAIAIGSLVSSGWIAGLAVEAFTAAATLGYYVLGGRDSDAGALFGSRADERQATIGLRASSLAGNVMGIVAVAGFAVQTARGGIAWPFALFCGVGAVSFLVGLVIYRHLD